MLAIEEIGQALDRGFLALVLIDQTPKMGYTYPHCVLVHGHGDGIYFINDPWIEPDRLEQAMDVFNLPVTAAALEPNGLVRHAGLPRRGAGRADDELRPADRTARTVPCPPTPGVTEAGAARR
ncbi:peptidase C39 family protein [Mesorhizobium sp. M0938]|uniref:peptidase C39 family protein n=1 Tax=unclassified Mesorhizobium TaxID=325217 RepID=UPI00333C50BF